jgi:hypothetical protein
MSSRALSDHDLIRIVSESVDAKKWDRSVASVATVRLGEDTLVEGERMNHRFAALATLLSTAALVGMVVAFSGGPTRAVATFACLVLFGETITDPLFDALDWRPQFMAAIGGSA